MTPFNYILIKAWEPIDRWLYENIEIWPDLPTPLELYNQALNILIEVTQ